MKIIKGIAIIICTAAVALGISAPARAEEQAPPARSLLQAQERAIVAAGVPGVSAQVRDENGVWNGVAGTGDLHERTAPVPQGEFRVGSITKSFIATVVLQLVAEHRVDLEAPVSEYLPNLLPYKQSITVHELLQHRSGLVDYANIQPSVLWPTPQDLDSRRFKTYPPRQLVKIATAHPLLFTPGSRWAYSNTNYIVLGLLIQKITGQSVATELMSRILLPAGLRHTFLAGAVPFLPLPAERGYEALRGSPGPLTDLTDYNMTWAWSAGAVVSTTTDLNRFYRALLTGKLLPRAQLAQMQQAVPISDLDGYGLGLMRAQACDDTVWGHNGSVPGFLTYSFSNADATRQVTITVNRNLTADPGVSAAIDTLLATEFCGYAPSPQATPSILSQRQLSIR